MNNEIIISFKDLIDYIRDKDTIITSQDYTIKNLNERINKAIEYIYKDFTHTDEEKDLLNILTGE